MAKNEAVFQCLNSILKWLLHLFWKDSQDHVRSVYFVFLKLSAESLGYICCVAIDAALQ